MPRDTDLDGEQDPVDEVRCLVDDALTALLHSSPTPGADAEIVDAFVTGLTPVLLAKFRARATAVGPVQRAEQAVSAALERFASGRVDDGRGELVIARGALVAARGPVPLPVVDAEPCDLCDQADPVWQIPLRGQVAPLLPGADSHLLTCQGCLNAINTTVDDAGLAAALGSPQLPRSLRGLHSRLTGVPEPHMS